MVNKKLSVESNVFQEALIANAKVEVLVGLLYKKGIITEEEFNSSVSLILDEKEK